MATGTTKSFHGKQNEQVIFERALSPAGSLGDLQVAVEVRFVTVKDDFFERIGVDFDVEFDSQPTTIPDTKFQPEQANDTDVAHTRELIPGLNQIDSSLEAFGIDAIPPDANTPTFPNFVGALLDEIQVNLLINTVENDPSATPLTAPTVTLFNNQRASVLIKNEQRFRDEMFPVFIDAADLIDPLINPYTTGPSLQITPIVSADRRFVLISVIPVLTALFNTPNVNGDRFLVQPIPVQTAVSVPDGGTVLLGGIKRLDEDRQNGTLPIIGNIPIVGRLFENRTVVMENDELIIMITPRIIIQEEEEEQ